MSRGNRILRHFTVLPLDSLRHHARFDSTPHSGSPVEGKALRESRWSRWSRVVTVAALEAELCCQCRGGPRRPHAACSSESSCATAVFSTAQDPDRALLHSPRSSNLLPGFWQENSSARPSSSARRTSPPMPRCSTVTVSGLLPAGASPRRLGCWSCSGCSRRRRRPRRCRRS